MVNNYIDEDDMYNDMPEGWWLKTSPWLYLLATLVHKANPDVISDPTQTRQGCTRVAMKNKEAAEIASEKEAEKNKPPTTVRAKAEEEMFTSKARIMLQTAEIGEIDIIERQVGLLERIKSSYINVVDKEGGDGQYK